MNQRVPFQAVRLPGLLQQYFPDLPQEVVLGEGGLITIGTRRLRCDIERLVLSVLVTAAVSSGEWKEVLFEDLARDVMARDRRLDRQGAENAVWSLASRGLLEVIQLNGEQKRGLGLVYVVPQPQFAWHVQGARIDLS